MDFSNKSLALLLVAAIVISLGGTLIGLNKLNQGVTGLASGRVQIEVTSLAGCNVDQNVSFGTNTTKAAVLSTELDNRANGFNDCSDGAGANNCKGLQINNTGNENIYVNLTSQYNASTFPGGASIVAGDFWWRVRNGTYANTLQGCRNITNLLTGANVNISNIRVCQNMTPVDGSDVMTVEFNVTLKTDTPTGAKTNLVTVDCNINS